MTLSELLENLEFEPRLYLIESGAPQKFRHYTDIQGFYGILKDGYIRKSPYYFGGEGISTVRPSALNIKPNEAPEFNDKNYCGFFEIDFEILNDKVRHIKKEPINEPKHEYTLKLESIARKYSMSKDVLRQCYDIAYDKDDPIMFKNELKIKFNVDMTIDDAEYFISQYTNLLYSLYYKEGEERIKGGSIPINEKYIHFYSLPLFKKKYNELSDMGKIRIFSVMKEYPKDLFKDNLMDNLSINTLYPFK